MSFPFHDPYWRETGDFLVAHAVPGDRILGPDIFWWLLPRLFRYRNLALNPGDRYDWVVLHKGELERLPRRFLDSVAATMRPCFANAVFVVFAADPRHGRIPATDPHVAPYFARAATVRTAAFEVPADDPVLPDPGRIERFALMDDATLRDAMDRFWRNGGYVYGTLHDRTYYAEIDRHLGRFLERHGGPAILDVACGTGRLGDLVGPGHRVTGIDISAVAIEMARRRHAARPAFDFAAMDAQRLPYPDRSFDTVLFVDAIEHVRDAEQVLREVGRVLVGGGTLFLTAANRDSLNQVVTRKLGHPGFVTNYQHIREFTFTELRRLLDETGLEVVDAGGIFLLPYWGVPGIDERVRPLTDEDPEIVELCRLLGERAGPEHAYLMTVSARRRDHT